MSLSTISRLKGCILGGAIGDAIGLYTEFLPRVECIRLYGPSPRFSLLQPPPAGYAVMHMDRHRAVFETSGWTDDTDQSLLIFMSWLRSGGTRIDEIDFAKRLKFWVCNGFTPLDRMPLGLGKTVGGVVRDSRYEGDPVRTAKEYAIVPFHLSETPIHHVPFPEIGSAQAVILPPMVRLCERLS